MIRKINLVSSCRATELHPAEYAWDELRNLFSKIHRTGEMNLRDYLAASDSEKKDDKDGPGWIPCSAIDQAGSRNQSNMDSAYFLVLDIDSGMDFGDVRKRIDGLEAVIHSSYSHRLEHPKCRVVLPLVAPVPAKDIGNIFDRFQERFDGLLDAACGHDPARLYYLPSCPSDAADLFHYEHIEGAFLDGQAILTSGIATAATVPAGAAVTTSAPVIALAGVSEGGRNTAAFKLAASLFGDGQDIDQVTDAVLVWNESNDPPLDATEVREVVKSASKTVARKAIAAIGEIDAIVDDMNGRFAWISRLHRAYRGEFRDFASIDSLRHQFANAGRRVRVGDSVKWQSHADIWYRSPNRRTHTDVDFVPGGDVIVDNKVNLWQGWGAVPMAGEVAPWVAFMDFLFAGDANARKWIEQWLAYPLQRPGAKLTTAVVLWSIRQGVGKSMLGETVGKLYGSHFKTIGASELHGSFNGWMKDCQLILGEENSSSDQRADSNRLKALITGNTVFVNEKYQPALELPNCANFIFTSNHPDAFHLDDADRRFFVWEIVADRQSNEFYDNFIDWRDNRGGLNALMDHFLRLDLTDFAPKGNAPATEAKLEMIRQSKSDLERWLNDALEDEVSVDLAFGKHVATLDEITEAYSRERRCRATTTATSRALRRHLRYASRRVVTRSGRKQLTSLVNHDAWEAADNATWAKEFEKPLPIRSRMGL